MFSRVGLGGTDGSSSFGKVREVSAKHSFVLWGLILPDAKDISGRCTERIVDAGKLEMSGVQVQ